MARPQVGLLVLESVQRGRLDNTVVGHRTIP